MPSIRPLCSEVTEKLQSGVTISGMAQCTEELILNSLDAGSTAIEIKVAPTSWSIAVADNGYGISFDDMKIVGNRSEFYFSTVIFNEMQLRICA